MANQEEMDHTCMGLALDLARQAAAVGEIPVGALVVLHAGPEARVIGRGFNQREKNSDATAHAEIVAMREAGQTLGQWRLLDCTLYVTLEPCPMCAGAAINARMPRLVYGCTDPKAGAIDTLFRLAADARLNHRIQTAAGVRAQEAADLLREFFRHRR